MLIIARDVEHLEDLPQDIHGGTLVLLSDSKCEISVRILARFTHIQYLQAPQKGLMAFLEGYIQGTYRQLERLGPLQNLLQLKEPVYYYSLKRCRYLPDSIKQIFPEVISEEDEEDSD